MEIKPRTLADFKTLFHREIEPLLLPLEARRKNFTARCFVTGSITVTLFGLGFLPEWLNKHFPRADSIVPIEGDFNIIQAIFLVGAIVGAIILFVSWLRFFKPYQKEFKRNVVRNLIHFLDPSFSYDEDSFIPFETYHATHLYRDHVDRYGGDDFVAGKLGDTTFEFSEIHSEYKRVTTDSKGRRQTRWITIFKGIFFIADFHKDFKGTTAVLPDNAEKLLGSIGQMFQSWDKSRGELIKLEDVEFEKEFAVYGTDQVEARYLLSTSMMRRILELRRRSGSKLRLCFRASKVFILIPHTKDLFEPPVFSTLLNFSLIEDYFCDLEFLFGMIEDLNLNTRIWAKD